MFRYLAFLLAMLIAQPALAAQCAPSQLMIAGLKAQYGEEPVWEGILEGENGKTLPVIWFVSPTTRTWTMVYNDGPQILCMLAKGSGFDVSVATPPVGPPL